MGATSLPIHNRKEKEKLSILTSNILRSPKKLMIVLVVILFFYYTLGTESQNEKMSILSSSSINYNINPLFWAPTLSDRVGKSAYPKEAFTKESLRENEFHPVSAVILRTTDNEESIVYTVKNMIKYPFITDIYIYNIVKNRPLTIEKLNLDNKVKNNINIEILESDEDLQSLARFTTCATASRLYCYFQDDTFHNPYMDSLYTNLLRFPTLIHANAKPSHYELNMKWRFNNRDIKLHTGYADFRYGAFVPRWKVQTFLTQLGKSGLDKQSIKQAEHYFAIWTNQYPWLLSNPPHLAKGEKALDYDVAYPDTLDLYTYDAVRHLQRSLRADQSTAPQDYFDRQEDQPALSHRDVKSSCANDRCLFITSMDPFVSPTQVTFDYENYTSIIKWEAAYDQVYAIPSHIEWDESSYHKAVDNDPHTCWNTIHNPKQGDYFGLILVGTTQTKNLIIETTQELNQPEKLFTISVLEQEDSWVQCRMTDKSTSKGRIVLSIYCPGVHYYRAIKATFTKDQSVPFNLCSLSIDNLSV